MLNVGKKKKRMEIRSRASGVGRCFGWVLVRENRRFTREFMSDDKSSVTVIGESEQRARSESNARQTVKFEVL